MTGPDEAPKVVEENRDYIDVLRGLVGKQVTVVNPESYEALPAGGSELREGHYVGEITGFGNDYFIFDTVLAATQRVELVAQAGGRVGHTQASGEHDQTAVQQYIPIARIKRLSLGKDSPMILLHL